MIKFINFLFLLLLLNACNNTGNDSGSSSSSSGQSSHQTPPPPPSDPDALAKAAAQAKITDAETKIKNAKAAKLNTKANAKQLDLAITGVETVITNIKVATKKVDIESQLESLELKLLDLDPALESFLKAKAVEKATATEKNADKLVAEVGTLKNNSKITPDKKTQLEALENTLNTTKTELTNKKADPKATTSDIEDLEKKLSTQTKELEAKVNIIVMDAGLISEEQEKAKEQADLIANNAKASLREVKDILNKGGSLSNTEDLDNKQIALGQALFNYEKLATTASKDEIDTAKNKIVSTLNDLNSAKTDFYAKENAGQEKLLAATVGKAKNLLTLITEDAKKQELQKIIDESNDMSSEKDPSVKMQKLNNLNNKIKAQIDEMNKELLKLQEDAAEAAKKAEEAKKTAEPKKDFPYTLLTLEGDASELEESVKKIYNVYPRQNIHDLNLLSNITGNKILIQNLKGNSGVKSPSFVTYDFNTKNSANLLETSFVLQYNPDLLKEFSLPPEELTKYNKSTNLVDKIKQVSSLESGIYYISVIGKIDEKLFITYQQGNNNKFLIKCNLNEPKNEIENCNNPVLIGGVHGNSNVKIAVAYDKKSALVYNAEKNIYFSFINDKFIEVTSNNQVASKENPLAVKSVDGLDAGHICANVFNNNFPIKAATKINNTWYVFANARSVKNTATDGADKICKITEETIVP